MALAQAPGRVACARRSHSLGMRRLACLRGDARGRAVASLGRGGRVGGLAGYFLSMRSRPGELPRQPLPSFGQFQGFRMA